MKQTILTAIAGHQTDAGRIVGGTAAGGRASYRSLIHLRDHLGSVRAVIDGDTSTFIEASDYYPFGKWDPAPVAEPVPVTEPAEVTRSIEATVASMVGELCRTTGSATVATAAIPLLDFGARIYDPLTARWTAQDPLAEKYYAVSPYAYCAGNPIVYLNPNGKTKF